MIVGATSSSLTTRGFLMASMRRYGSPDELQKQKNQLTKNNKESEGEVKKEAALMNWNGRSAY